MSAETIIVFRIHDIDSVIIIKQNCMIPFWTRIFLQEIHKGFEESKKPHRNKTPSNVFQ